MTETRVVQAFAVDLKAAEESGRWEISAPPGYDRPMRLIDMLPWPRRVLAWCLWRTPLRKLFYRHFISPYVLVVASVRPKASDTVSLDPAPSL